MSMLPLFEVITVAVYALRALLCLRALLVFICFPYTPQRYSKVQFFTAYNASALPHINQSIFCFLSQYFAKCQAVTRCVLSFQKLSGEEKYGLPPDSVETFIRLLRSRNDKLQEELAEAEDAVKSASLHENAAALVDNKNREDDTKISSEVNEEVIFYKMEIWNEIVHRT